MTAVDRYSYLVEFLQFPVACHPEVMLATLLGRCFIAAHRFLLIFVFGKLSQLCNVVRKRFADPAVLPDLTILVVSRRESKKDLPC
jgi:hypothetical protein